MNRLVKLLGALLLMALMQTPSLAAQSQGSGQHFRCPFGVFVKIDGRDGLRHGGAIPFHERGES